MIIYDHFNLMSLAVVLFIFASIFLVVTNYDKIDIDISQSFEPEYNQCVQDLENTQPICPACECTTDYNVGAILYSFVFGALLMFLFYDYIVFPRMMKYRLGQYEKLKKVNKK